MQFANHMCMLKQIKGKRFYNLVIRLWLYYSIVW